MIAKPAYEPPVDSTFNVSEDDAPILAMVQDALAKEIDSGFNESDTVLTLSLGDLLADPNGEVVLFNDSNLRAVALETSHKLMGSGEVETHRTVSGDDVTGYQYLSFDNGTTLYFQDGLNVILVDQA